MRYQQPQSGPAQIDWSNPITRGLVFAALPGGPELISGVLPTPMGGASLSVCDKGRSLQSNSLTTDGWCWNLPASHPLYSITTTDSLFVQARRTAGSAFNNLFGVPYRTGTWATPFYAWGLASQSDTTTANATFATSSSTRVSSVSSAAYFQNGVSQAYGFTRGNTRLRYYRGAAQYDGDYAIASATVDWTNHQPPTLFNASNSVPQQGMQAQAGLVLVFNRELTASEWSALSDNPWLIFKSPRRATLAPAVAGVSTALAWLEASDTASISAAATASGTLTWAESSDACAIAASATASASCAWAEASDAVAISALVGNAVSASTAWAESTDIASLTASVKVSASAAWAEAGDVAAISASVGNSVAANITWAEASDAATITAAAQVSASTAWAEASDSASLATSVGSTVAANIAWQEQSDTVAMLTTVRVNVSAGWAEQSDLSGFSAQVLVSAGLVWLEQGDVVAVAVNASSGVSASISWVESPDIALIALASSTVVYARAPAGDGYTALRRTETTRPAATGEQDRPAATQGRCR